MDDSLEPPSAEIEQCERCARPIYAQRLSLKFLITDAMKNLFNLERGLLFTFLELLKSPGKVSRAFVEGNRFKYMNPFRFLLVAATISVLIEALSPENSMLSIFNVTGSDENSAKVIGEFMREYLNIIILGTVPFYAISTWLIFRKPKWNLAEHLVVNAYGLSMVVILDGVLALVTMPLGSELALQVEGFSQILNLLMAYVYISTWSYHWLKGILLMIVSFMVASIMAILTGATLMITYRLLFP